MQSTDVTIATIEWEKPPDNGFVQRSAKTNISVRTMKNRRIKVLSMVGGSFGMVSIALGLVSRSQLGLIGAGIGLLAVGTAAKTLKDVRDMERAEQ